MRQPRGSRQGERADRMRMGRIDAGIGLESPHTSRDWGCGRGGQLRVRSGRRWPLGFPSEEEAMKLEELRLGS